MFTPTWEDDPIWLIWLVLFKCFETTLKPPTIVYSLFIGFLEKANKTGKKRNILFQDGNFSWSEIKWTTGKNWADNWDLDKENSTHL